MSFSSNISLSKLDEKLLWLIQVDGFELICKNVSFKLIEKMSYTIPSDNTIGD